MLTGANADVYTDLQGLARLKTSARNDDPEAVTEVARQFESLFLSMVLKSMRQAKLSDGLLDNDQSDFYRDMYDQQLALHLSARPGIGLAGLIAEQLGAKSDDDRQPRTVEEYLNRSVSVPARSRAADRPNTATPAVTPSATETVEKTEDRPITRPAQFVRQLRPYAEQAAAELGVAPGVLLAQAALETGWGRAVLQHSDGGSSFNLFNIKADSSWQGQQVRRKTLEFVDGIGRQEMAAFRAYGSYRDSFNDYVHFIKDNPRYHKALAAAADPRRYLLELQRAGYATDPNYADKVLRVYRGDAFDAATVAMR